MIKIGCQRVYETQKLKQKRLLKHGKGAHVYTIKGCKYLTMYVSDMHSVSKILLK